jgi:thiamine biosynthesis protein ThiS
MRHDRASIVANGQPVEVNVPCSVADFIAGRGWKATQVVVEHNGHVLRREGLAQAMIREGDRLVLEVPNGNASFTAYYQKKGGVLWVFWKEEQR